MAECVHCTTNVTLCVSSFSNIYDFSKFICFLLASWSWSGDFFFSILFFSILFFTRYFWLKMVINFKCNLWMRYASTNSNLDWMKFNVSLEMPTFAALTFHRIRNSICFVAIWFSENSFKSICKLNCYVNVCLLLAFSQFATKFQMKNNNFVFFGRIQHPACADVLYTQAKNETLRN